MDLALITRLAPLASLVGRPVSSVSDSEVEKMATALAGGDADTSGLVSFLKQLRLQSPDQPAVSILGSDAAQSLFKKLSDTTKQVNKTMFCTCPACELNFEVELTE